MVVRAKMTRAKEETSPGSTLDGGAPESIDDIVAPEGTMEAASIRQDNIETEINTSLDEVLDLLAQEVERLQVALEFYRLSDHADKEKLIRWHVQQIDTRQDRLEDIKSLILAGGKDWEH